MIMTTAAQRRPILRFATILTGDVGPLNFLRATSAGTEHT